MASFESYNIRRLARIFTPMTPNHHPFLDPDFPEEDISLVPSALAPRGQLNWELPKKAVANLHIMLKLSNNADELLDEFHHTIPQINEALNDWVEMKGASPTKIGEEQLRARSFMDSQSDSSTTLKANKDDYVFNMARNLDNPGRADVIYLTEGVQDFDSLANGSAEHIRSIDWLDFDGSYVHLQDLKEPIEPKTTMPGALQTPKVNRRKNIPSKLEPTRREAGGEFRLTPTVYNPAINIDAGNIRTQSRPFDKFWCDHAPPHERPGSLRSPLEEKCHGQVLCM